MDSFLRRTWAEINLDHIRYNYQVIRQAVAAESMVMGVVKADAYGHGDGFVARELEEAGADWMAVSNIHEGVALRKKGISTPILILGYTPPALAEKLAQYRITQALFCKQYGQELSQQAVEKGVCVDVHIKVDSGMGRLGFLSYDRMEEQIEEIVSVCSLPNLTASGIFTHFAVADETDGVNYTHLQFNRFQQVCEELKERGISFSIRHCCNSAGVSDYPEMHLDLVRPGIILYGIQASGQIRNPLPLKPAMSLKSIVSMVKPIEKGDSVSYGRIFTADHTMMVATVPIGYADGYPRLLSNRARMLVRGQFAPVIGRVCMDQVMLDVSGIDGVQEGDVVTVFGQDGDKQIDVEELSTLAGTIPYETVCLIGKRVPRIFIKNGETVGVLDYVCPEI